MRVKVDSHSMDDAITINDTVLVNRISYKFGDADRYDVVCFKYGKDKEVTSIKRVIGLPSETVQIKNGDVYINSKKLDMPYSNSKYAVAGLAERPILLGPDEYFLLGDKNDSSEDSRFEAVGPVNIEDIEGKVWVRILPISRFEFNPGGK